MSEVSALLDKSRLFASLAPAHRHQIASYLTRHELAANVEVVRQGDAADALYLLAAGAVGVFVRDTTTGVSTLQTTVEPPESFGDVALVQGVPHSATWATTEATILYRMSKDVFDAIAGQVPAMALAMAAMFARRIEQMTAEREVPWTSLGSKKFDLRLWASFPELTLRQGRIVPLSLSGRTLTVGMVDPLDTSSLDTLARVVPGVRFKVYAVSPEDWQRFVDAGTARAGVTTRTTAVNSGARMPVMFLEDEDQRGGSQKVAGAAASPAIAAVDEIVGTGLGAGASDIHIEPERKGIGVRYRIDGALQARLDPISPELGKAIVSRIKLLAKLDITETRKPQDGRISVRAAGNKFMDLRVSTLPSKFGEKIVMRVLDSEGAIADLKALFQVEKVRQVFTQMIFRPNGLVLVTGPTGSGKTTTMYSALFARRRPELNITTVEDPIEYHLDGIIQTQVAADSGTTFGSILRALLRQDPDVIMVGELRDAETARMAVEASNTGHLVITSLHTNGALEAVVRMSDLGIERYALANSLAGVLHQRLVRRICKECVEPFEYPLPILEILVKAGALRAGEQVTLYRGKGCPRCNGTGFRGRAALYEMLVATEAVKEAISRGVDPTALKAAALQGGLVELSRYAGLMITAGVTVPGEVLQYVQRVDD